MQPEEITKRAKAIRLPLNELARRAGGPCAHTVGRVLSRKTGSRMSTFEAIEAALLQEEKRLRDYLNRLPEAKGRPADDWEAA